jgi:hypothetical protein
MAVALACAALAACGTPGAPRPPSLRLPETVRDLAATRQGSTVSLTWTEPQRTTDGETIRVLGPTLVCMGVNDFPMTHCDQMVADLTLKQFAECTPQVGKPASCAITLPFEIQQQNPSGTATYAIEVLNTNGRSAGLSNQVLVPTAGTPEPIPDVSATLTPNAVVLKFTGFGPGGYAYHVFRAEAGTEKYADLGAAQLANPGFMNARVEYGFADRSFDWEKTYNYHVVGITTAHLANGSNLDVPGDPTPNVKVFAHDTFPPATPQGLQAVASGVGQQTFVDLSWAPNTEADLAGYNVYRQEQGQTPVKINTELVKAPSYRDPSVQPGKTYFYSISAADLRNNESSKSPQASETVH